MAHKRLTTLSIGSISEGTLNPADLIGWYLYEAERLRLTRAERATVRRIRFWDNQHNPSACRPSGEYRKWDSAEWDEHAHEHVETLADILSAHVPDYCYFGSTEGDGACIGVWPSFDMLDGYHDNDVARVSDTSELRDLSKGYSHALHVNGHGNCTLYRRAGNQWRKVWSVV